MDKRAARLNRNILIASWSQLLATIPIYATAPRSGTPDAWFYPLSNVGALACVSFALNVASLVSLTFSHLIHDPEDEVSPNLYPAFEAAVKQVSVLGAYLWFLSFGALIWHIAGSGLTIIFMSVGIFVIVILYHDVKATWRLKLSLALARAHSIWTSSRKD